MILIVIVLVNNKTLFSATKKCQEKHLRRSYKPLHYFSWALKEQTTSNLTADFDLDTSEHRLRRLQTLEERLWDYREDFSFSSQSNADL